MFSYTLQHDQYVTHYVCKELENVNVNLSVTPQYSIVNSITYPPWQYLLTALGSTILPGFLFQKQYLGGAACWLPVSVSHRRKSANDNRMSNKTVGL